MKITEDRKLRDLQREFNERFPYLKIEFYAKPHGLREDSAEEDRLDSELEVGEVQEFPMSGTFEEKGSMSTTDFEQAMSKHFGLHTQVFRKSYGKWLQTWATDNWTLAEQNRRGEIMEKKGAPIA
jgi:hypothetical protein